MNEHNDYDYEQLLDTEAEHYGDVKRWADLGYEHLYAGDFDKALDCFRKGAEDNDMYACWGIVELYDNGLPKDPVEQRAARYEQENMFGKAASLGHEKARQRLGLDMEKSLPELAAELLVKNQNTWWGGTIEVKDEDGNLFTFVFTKPGYSEYTTFSFDCHSDLFERPIGFGITAIYERLTMAYFYEPNGAQWEIGYDKEMVSKHEKTLRRAIELALPLEAKKPER